MEVDGVAIDEQGVLFNNKEFPRPLLPAKAKTQKTSPRGYIRKSLPGLKHNTDMYEHDEPLQFFWDEKTDVVPKKAKTSNNSPKKMATFMTQVQDPVYIDKDQLPQKQRSPSADRTEQIMRLYVPHLPKKTRLGNLKKVPDTVYDIEDDFNPDEEMMKIPENLLKFIQEDSKSPVARALCGWSLRNYPVTVYQQVIQTLGRYLKQCVNENYISESSYVKCILDDVKHERDERSQREDTDVARLSAQLEFSQDQYERHEEHWKHEQNLLESEREIAIRNVDLKYEQALSDLKEEWNSEKAAAKFNKPSGKLIELRQHAKTLLNAHRFDEVNELLKFITEQEQKETEEATYEMNKAYHESLDRLKQTFDQEKDVVEQSYNMKLLKIQKDQEADLRPIKQRVDSLTRMRDSLIMEKKSRAKRKTPVTRSQPVKSTKPLVINSKLKLAPLMR